MSQPDRRPDDAPDPSLLDRIFDNIFPLSIIALLLVVLAMLLGVDVSVARWHVLAALTLVVFSPWGWFLGGRLANRVDDEPDVFLVDVDAPEPKGALYAIPVPDFHRLEVVDGDLDQWGPMLYCGKNVDLEEMTVEGVWRGTLTDRELLSALSAVEECRGMLEDDARQAFALESNLWSIVYRATKDATTSVIDTFENGTLPDQGEGVDAAVNDALDDFGLLDRLDDLDQDEPDPQPDAEDFELSPEEQTDETLPRPADD